MADTSRDARLLSRGRRLKPPRSAGTSLVWPCWPSPPCKPVVALAGFGLDSLIEIGASTVVLWELADVSQERQHRAMRFIGIAFICLAVYPRSKAPSFWSSASVRTTVRWASSGPVLLLASCSDWRSARPGRGRH